MAGSCGDVDQGQQQATANAARSICWRHHQGKFRLALLRDIFAVSLHFAAGAEGKNSSAIAVIQLKQSAQQRLVRRLAMGEVALIEAFAIHCRQEAPHSLVIGRTCRAKPEFQQIRDPIWSGGHGCSPATKSAAA